MKTNELRKKNIKELNKELLNLTNEQWNMRMQAISNKFKQTHLFKQVRRSIARIKTILTEKANNIL